MNRILAISCLLAMLVMNTASAEVIAGHEGRTDPMTEGWSLTIRSPNNVSGGTETTLSGQYDFWQTADISTAGGSYVNYRNYVDPALLDSKWIVEATIRLVDGPLSPGWEVGVQLIALYDGYTNWGVFLAEGSVALTSKLGTKAVHVLPFATQSDYHVYRLVFIPNGPGRADDAADIFIDGNLVFSNIPREDFWQNPNWDSPHVFFGSGNSVPVGRANWSRVLFHDANLLSVSTSVVGGNEIECNAPGAGRFNVVADFTSDPNDPVTSIEWYLDNVLVDSGESIFIEAGLGDHVVEALVTTTGGETAQSTLNVSVEDTTAPTLFANFYDAKGNQIASVTRSGLNFITVDYVVEDVCDGSPSVEGFGGVDLPDNSTVRVQASQEDIILESTELRINVQAQDSSGNLTEGEFVLGVTN